MFRFSNSILIVAWWMFLAGAAGAETPQPPRRPADLSLAPPAAPLPPPRPPEFSRRAAKSLPSWRPDSLPRESRLIAPYPTAPTAPSLQTPSFVTPTPPMPPASLAPPVATADELKECDALLAAKKVHAVRLPSIGGPNGCSVAAPVSLQALVLNDGRTIPLDPPPTVRCDLAARVADWLELDAIPQFEEHGAHVRRIIVLGGYQCRHRNNLPEGKMSEHGQGGALDLGAVEFDDGHRVAFSGLSNDLASALRTSACTYFATVLGPGSDAAHADHIHVDIERRRNNNRLCQWEKH